MLLAGDERGRTQKGNNNAYCQDNATSWVDWSEGNKDQEVFTNFVRRLIALRKRYPVLCANRYLHGNLCSAVTGFRDLEWYAPEGVAMETPHWLDPEHQCLGWVLAGDAARPNLPHERTATLLVILNAQPRAVRFHTPAAVDASVWQCVLDTTRADGDGRHLRVQAGKPFPAEARGSYVFVLESAEGAAEDPITTLNP